MSNLLFNLVIQNRNETTYQAQIIVNNITKSSITYDIEYSYMGAVIMNYNNCKLEKNGFKYIFKSIAPLEVGKKHIINFYGIGLPPNIKDFTISTKKLVK
jgi:hypothetical protein